MRRVAWKGWAGCLAVSLASTTACLSRDVVEQEPNTSNIFVEQQQSSVVDKIDLLFVVDNSTSMADKQSILEDAVPVMLERLVRPDCVTLDENGAVTSRAPSTAAAVPGDDPSCPDGTSLEFRPIGDMHIGVISSSLGGHGSSKCSQAENNDRALLLPKVRPGLVDPHGTGFLVWKPQAEEGEPSEGDLEQLSRHFREHVLGAGESGCGFEAPLEAWFRFMVDPAPPLEVTVEGYSSSPVGIDQAVLDQRAAFLRPDSLVAVVMLTDENDCSIMDGGDEYPNAGLGWALAEHGNGFPTVGGGPNPTKFPLATSYCDENPNHACCFSCFRDDLPSGCNDPGALSACSAVGQPRLSPELDRANVRCFDGKRRFGVDLLYPVERYVDAVVSPEVVNRATGQAEPNPLLRGVDGLSPRPPERVFVAGITGVPWQDIADEESLNDDTRLSYLTATQLAQPTVEFTSELLLSRWDLIVGNRPAAMGSEECDADPQCGEQPVAPLDPFMIESIDVRSGSHPLTGTALTSSSWNPINGHDRDLSFSYNLVNGTDDLPARDDLQFSCIFPLEPYGGVELDCDPEENPSCDCVYGTITGSPLCKETPDAAASTSQYFGKAYPASRVLEVLRGVGPNAVVASICPKIHDPLSPDFGYNPAISAIVDRLGEKLKGQCLPRQLGLDDDGRVPCAVVEVLHPRDGQLSCAPSEGRGPVTEDMKRAVGEELSASEFCVGSDCGALSMCEVRQQLEPGLRDDCLSGPLGSEASQAPGYCYIDPAQGLGDTNLVASCPASERQLLRFVGPDTPKPGTTVVVACVGEQTGGGSIPPPPG